MTDAQVAMLYTYIEHLETRDEAAASQLLKEAISYVVIAAPSSEDNSPVYCQSCRLLKDTAEDIDHSDNCIVTCSELVIGA